MNLPHTFLKSEWNVWQVIKYIISLKSIWYHMDRCWLKEYVWIVPILCFWLLNVSLLANDWLNPPRVLTSFCKSSVHRSEDFLVFIGETGHEEVRLNPWMLYFFILRKYITERCTGGLAFNSVSFPLWLLLFYASFQLLLSLLNNGNKAPTFFAI